MVTDSDQAVITIRDQARGSGVARDNLAHFKAPRGVTFVDDLPKTATGKIQKYVLRKGAPNLTAQ